MDVLPRIKSVSASRTPWTLNVTWADGTKDRVNLTGLIHRSRHFRVFLDNAAEFRKVYLSAFGGGIEWRNGLDYGADTLKMMADEQRPVSGRDLVAFQSALNLSTAETAALLGLAERTVRAYRRARWLPQSVAIAIRAIRASHTVLAAHYRPVGHLARGRPKKQATIDRGLIGFDRCHVSLAAGHRTRSRPSRWPPRSCGRYLRRLFSMKAPQALAPIVNDFVTGGWH